MRRTYRSQNGLSPSTNRFIGRFLYLIFFLGIIALSYKIWGIQMFDEIWFYLMEAIAYLLVKITLLATGIWVY